MMDRKGSTDSNVFISKGQEMMHSFHEDELSKSILSGKSKMEGRRESLFSGSNERDPVDWKEAISHKEGANQQRTSSAKFRAQASNNDVEDFLSRQVTDQVKQLDAVSEENSQMGATPFNVVGD